MANSNSLRNCNQQKNHNQITHLTVENNNALLLTMDIQMILQCKSKEAIHEKKKKETIVKI